MLPYAGTSLHALAHSCISHHTPAFPCVCFNLRDSHHVHTSLSSRTLPQIDGCAHPLCLTIGGCKDRPVTMTGTVWEERKASYFARFGPETGEFCRKLHKIACVRSRQQLRLCCSILSLTNVCGVFKGHDGWRTKESNEAPICKDAPPWKNLLENQPSPPQDIARIHCGWGVWPLAD